MFKEYWHFDNITNKSESDFINDYWRWAKKKGYRPSEFKAKAIYAMAQDGIPTLPSSAASTKMLTLEAIRVLREINRTLESILTQIQALAKALPEYAVVRAMPGALETYWYGLSLRLATSGASIVATRLLPTPASTPRLINQEVLSGAKEKYPNEVRHFYGKQAMRL